jgi:hypothetical protein
MRARRPWTRWLRLSFVLTCTVSSVVRSAAAVASVSGGEDEVAAHRDEHLHPAVPHRLDRADGVESVLSGRGDPAHLVERVEERGRGAVVDAAGAVALDIAVAAHRRGSGALAAEVAAQHQQVHDLADGVHPVVLLGDAQAPGDDGAVGAQVALGDLPDLALAHPGLPHQLGPVGGAHQVAV